LLLENEFASKEYTAWRNMVARCHNEDNPKYPWYGGRGIRVCDAWRGCYRDFLEHIGRAPSKAHTLERIDNEKGYQPKNVRWATQKEQAQNRRSNRILEYQGQRKTLAAWADWANMDRRRLWRRLDAGWSLHDALTTRVATPYRSGGNEGETRAAA
jgi:hypothetical protein